MIKIGSGCKCTTVILPDSNEITISFSKTSTFGYIFDEIIQYTKLKSALFSLAISRDSSFEFMDLNKKVSDLADHAPKKWKLNNNENNLESYNNLPFPLLLRVKHYPVNLDTLKEEEIYYIYHQIKSEMMDKRCMFSLENQMVMAKILFFIEKILKNIDEAEISKYKDKLLPFNLTVNNQTDNFDPIQLLNIKTIGILGTANIIEDIVSSIDEYQSFVKLDNIMFTKMFFKKLFIMESQKSFFYGCYFYKVRILKNKVYDSKKYRNIAISTRGIIIFDQMDCLIPVIIEQISIYSIHVVKIKNSSIEIDYHQENSNHPLIFDASSNQKAINLFELINQYVAYSRLNINIKIANISIDDTITCTSSEVNSKFKNKFKAIDIEYIEGLGYGMQISSLDDESGLLVTKVLKNSSAAKHRVQIGDRIISIDGNDVRSMTFQQVMEKLLFDKKCNCNFVFEDNEKTEYDMNDSISDKINHPCMVEIDQNTFEESKRIMLMKPIPDCNGFIVSSIPKKLYDQELLKPGDLILMINGVSCSKLTLMQIQKEINQNNKLIQLYIIKNYISVPYDLLIKTTNNDNSNSLPSSNLTEKTVIKTNNTNSNYEYINEQSTYLYNEFNNTWNQVKHAIKNFNFNMTPK